VPLLPVSPVAPVLPVNRSACVTGVTRWTLETGGPGPEQALKASVISDATIRLEYFTMIITGQHQSLRHCMRAAIT